ncbi:hypothetical protein [Streptomonospora alba]|uniref:hypothetical protein n=1 Tax=Streptomonospora alba TaxID=183763 RepID=UPI003083CC4B
MNRGSCDRADLAVGAPGENEGQGAVWTLRFTGEGVAGTGSYGPKALGVSGPESRVGDAFAD